jgi:hypothetical protein
MKYIPPYGSTDPNAEYVDINQATATEGSPVSAAAIEHPMREITAVIEGAGLTPSDSDLTQLYQAMQHIAAAAASRPRAGASQVSIDWTSTTTLVASVAAAVLVTATGETYRIYPGGSYTINTSATGVGGCDVALSGFSANGFGYVYLIYNPTGPAVGAILSTSPTNPQLPTGYTDRKSVV